MGARTLMFADGATVIPADGELLYRIARVAREAVLHRADLALRAGRAVLARASGPGRAALDLAVTRVEALRGLNNGAGAATERELAAALDSAARLLAYLGGP